MTNRSRLILSLFITTSLLWTNHSFGQDTFITGPNDTIRVRVTITEEGIKLPTGDLPPIYLLATLTKQWRKYYEAWTRLKNAVFVTYPYAKQAAYVFNEINRELQGVTNRRERKRIIKSHEKELRQRFTSKLKNLSIYQGKVLMKLIYRETGNSCYEIIDEYKGDFSAIVYQGVAKIFGSSLKQTYDANGEDHSIEILVQQAQAYYGY